MASPTEFYIDKTAQTFADTLVAYGWARALSELHERQGTRGEITIHDDGSYFRVTMVTPIAEATLESLREQPVAPGSAVIIRTPKNQDKVPENFPHIVDYEKAKEERNLFFASRDKTRDDQASPPPPHPDWDIYRAINPGAIQGYNGLLTSWWTVRAAQPEIFALLFEIFSKSPNDVARAIDAWKRLDKQHRWGVSATATCQQLYNPGQGKGQNRAKADGVKMDNMDGFWLLEWLKLVGFYEAALTRQMRGTKDRKTFIVTPRALSFADSSSIMSEFKDTMRYSETSTRFDILATIRYLQNALTYFNEPQRRHQLLSAGNIKHKLVGGFSTAFYKDLGNTTATMNIAFIALPGWVEIRSPDDVAIYQSVLGELEMVVRQFDETHSDAFTLLQYLRDFVSGDDLDAFFRFSNAFPAYLIGKREQGKYAYQLTTTFIERLIMSTEPYLSEILTNEGFQNIAYAIRQSTVIPQYRKSQGNRSKYDIRYGLGQELARQARYKDAFVTALSDFLFKYNAENAQVMETRGGPFRRSVKTSDIDEIVRLIDRFGSQIVANLLIAYGYARVPSDADSNVEPDTQDTQEEIE